MGGQTSSNKSDEYDKKSANWDQSILTPRRLSSTFSYLGIRHFITWFFLVLSVVYILYSSNLLLTNENQDCSYSTNSRVLSSEENLPTVISLKNSSSSSNSTNQKMQQQQQQEEKQDSLMKLQTVPRFDTELKHIVFCIAGSSKLWDKRKQYIKQWWRPGDYRGVVWLDEKVRTTSNEGLPDIKISGDTSKFPYTNRQGKRSALRISRVVSETLRLKMKDVRWFVMGDDDTVFIAENVLRVLSKYDHNQFYYVGSSSESHVQNIYFSYAMAYGGGGFAISYPLAMALEKIQDRCMTRYPGLYGSDDRIQACMAELGVPLTREMGFHQYDVFGNLLGLLAAHPVAPLVSLHHLDVVDSIFPKLGRVKSIERLFDSIKLDSSSIMQQSICYDKKRGWSISVSWGYVVQIIRGVMSPRELEMPTRTFLNWYKRADYTGYAFNTRPVTKHPCQKPFIYYMNTVHYDSKTEQTTGTYTRHKEGHPYCRWKTDSPEKIDSIVVVKKTDRLRWSKSPRRDCCRVLPSAKSSAIYISIHGCQEGEISEL